MMGLFFPATAAENCACYLTFYSQWMQATFHACTGSFKRCQSCPTISGVSLTMKKMMGLFFPATAAENCACDLTFYSQWIQATFHACTGSCHRCQTFPTISGESVTIQELIRLLFSATRGGKMRLIPHILFSKDAGDLPRLYRILPSL